MEFENMNDSEILLIQGGGKGDIFYDLGWWLASKYKDVAVIQVFLVGIFRCNNIMLLFVYGGLFR